MFLNDLLVHDRIRNQVGTRIIPDKKLLGVSGTQNSGGFITDEDENKEWSDPENRVKNVSIMRSTCVRTRQSLQLLKTPLLGATMRIEPASDDNVDIKNAMFVEEMLFSSPFFRWDDAIREQLTYLDFGNSLLEKAYTRLNGKLWLSKLAFRKPQTIFEYDTFQDGMLRQVRQTNLDFGDEGEALPMPAENIVFSVYEQEGNNYMGFSALRPAWINWKAKMFLIKGDMVRYERWGIGTPMIEVEGNDIPQEAVDAVQKFRSNSEGFLAKTKKWGMTVFGGGRNSGLDIEKMVLFHDHQILFNVMANFMAKGEAQVGNFALTKVAADMFFNNVEREANHLENIWNEPDGLMSNIPQIMHLNFGDGVGLPKLRIENLELNDLEGFANRMKLYVDAGALDMTPDIKKHVRVMEKYPLTDLENEQLASLDNYNPTIKRIDSGRPYVLQYSKGAGKTLKLARVRPRISGPKLAVAA